MKKNFLVVLMIEIVILVLVVATCPPGSSGEAEQPENSLSLYKLYMAATGNEETELLRESSPDGGYTLLITEVGEPDFPFGSDHLQVTLFEVVPAEETSYRYYRASFMADVANDGARAVYQIEWLEDGVQIALSGQEQPTAYYVLPFRTLDD